ncbi:hypothetical protein [Candidatus Neptunochlamydia vexilliferae]|uniref:hypothetical protein n=1 Tax=Candidatus Neptunichlamydia vexilliferae TaxID=1651774 RepID=UPI001891843B|nr:hypothetical protein [Candidatus Neptunochlamydia vexilliferae]
MSATSNSKRIDIEIPAQENLTKSLEHITTKDFTKLFNRFYEKISCLSGLTKDIQDRDTLIKVKTFALHFLSRGSTIPILTDHDIIDRSPLDYLRKKDNKATYYRGDGSPTLQIFKQVFKDRLPNNIDFNNKYSAGLIKPNRFPIAMERSCTYHNLGYTKTSKITSIQTQNNLVFFDISEWIKGFFTNDSDDIDIVNLKIAKTVKNLNKQQGNFFFGGVLKVNEYVGVYIFFSKNNCHLKKGNKEYKAIAEMLDHRGVIGGYPEMIMIKRALAETGFKILSNTTENSRLSSQSSNFSSSSSSSSSSSHSNQNQLAKNTLKNAKDKLQGCKNQLFSSYTELILTLLEDILDRIQENDLTKFSAKKILEDCQSLNNNLSFQEALNHYHSIIEEIIFCSLFVKQEKELEEVIHTSLPDKDGTVLCYNSGMACFDYILQAILEDYKNKTPSLNVLESSYYEIKDELVWLLSKWNVSTIKNNDEFSEDLDLLVLDLYPNNVTLEKVEESPVVKLVEKALSNREDKLLPLTVVLDTSTTLLTEKKIWDIKKALENEIQSGKLRLVLTTSLAKFYSCGFDKYTGGAIVCFEKEDTLSLRLKKSRDKDLMSKEAESFFSLFIGKGMTSIENYYKTILENTNALYERLKKDELILQERDQNIPVIGIHPKGNDNKELATATLEKRVAQSAPSKDLPFFIRASFPFPHTTAVECYTALRVVAGLDAKKNIEKYASLFKPN